MNKLGQGLAVGITAISAAVVAVAGLMAGQPMEIAIVMLAPVGVAFFILIGDGWE